MASPERRRRRLRNGSGRTAGTATGNDASTSNDASTGNDAGDDISDGDDASPGYPEPAGGTAATSSVHDPEPPPVPETPVRRRGPDPSPFADERDGERGLRGLIGSGASQLSVGAALRARDATRPTDADLAEAAERLVIIRRNWVPREDLPRSGR